MFKNGTFADLGGGAVKFTLESGTCSSYPRTSSLSFRQVPGLTVCRKICSGLQILLLLKCFFCRHLQYLQILWHLQLLRLLLLLRLSRLLRFLRLFPGTNGMPKNLLRPEILLLFCFFCRHLQYLQILRHLRLLRLLLLLRLSQLLRFFAAFCGFSDKIQDTG